jgi:hypothetical protein
MRRVSFAVWLLLAALLPACQFGGTSENLEYTAPIETGIDVGQSIPGTGITYAGQVALGADLVINGQHAFKQKGDSVEWSGAPVGGMTASFSGRVLLYNESTCHVIGTVKVSIPKPDPQAAPNVPESPVRFRAVVTYGIAKGGRIPGTLVTYVRKATEGAELSGIEGYAFRKPGDSIVWQGKLRDGVYVIVNVREVFATEMNLQVAGTVEVVLVPPGPAGSGLTP